MRRLMVVVMMVMVFVVFVMLVMLVMLGLMVFVMLMMLVVLVMLVVVFLRRRWRGVMRFFVVVVVVRSFVVVVVVVVSLCGCVNRLWLGRRWWAHQRETAFHWQANVGSFTSAYSTCMPSSM